MAVLDSDSDSETIGGMILTTGSILTGTMIHSITATGTRLFTSISVSETGGIIIIMDGMDEVITAIGTITGHRTIHIMIVMAIIMVGEGTRLQFTRQDIIQAAIPDLYLVTIYHEEIIHLSIHRVTHSVIIT